MANVWLVQFCYCTFTGGIGAKWKRGFCNVSQDQINSTKICLINVPRLNLDVIFVFRMCIYSFISFFFFYSMLYCRSDDTCRAGAIKFPSKLIYFTFSLVVMFCLFFLQKGFSPCLSKYHPQANSASTESRSDQNLVNRQRNYWAYKYMNEHGQNFK